MENIEGDVDEIFQWKDQYCIGVEIVDEAHQRLFSIVRRLIKNLDLGNFEKNKKTCIEAIKYLKKYTVEHFAQEEAYQQQIGYGGYENHKRIHTDMREITLPALEKQMIESDFSKKSVEHFAGVCAAWLTSHIMYEDQAIVGKFPSRWNTDINVDAMSVLSSMAQDYMQRMFQIKIEPENLDYEAYNLGNTLHYYMIFKGKKKDIYRTCVTFERELVCKVLETIVCKPVLAFDELSLSVFKELSRDFASNFISAYNNDEPVVINEGIVDKKAFVKDFKAYHPDISLLWNSSFGHSAFCLKTVSPKAKV